jgi:hypothetical protein
MRRLLSIVCFAALAAVLAVSSTSARPDDPKTATKEAPAKPAESPAYTQGFFKYRIQEIDRQLKVGYAVVIADVNGDGKPDIVVADVDRVVWYENPTWQRRIIIENKRDPKTGAIVDKKTDPDNVSIAPVDIDGDGKVDFVLAARWTGFDSKTPGTLQWLRRGKSLDEQWEVHPIPCDEPAIHRVRVADLYGEGKPRIIVAPLMGLGSTHGNNWMDGRPVRLLTYKIPADPVKGPWVPEVLDESLHVVHGIYPVYTGRPGGANLLAASYEGVTLFIRNEAGKWVSARLGEGNQKTQQSNRGASEVALGSLKNNKFLATIEPWHGGQVVAYVPGSDPNKDWARNVLDDKLKWGHAVRCADLDGDGNDEIIVGVRDDPGPGQFLDRRGVRIYRNKDGNGRNWERQMVDEGGVAVEDLAVADLNGDGRPDIIAVGRQTGNVRIYWNLK